MCVCVKYLVAGLQYLGLSVCVCVFVCVCVCLSLVPCCWSAVCLSVCVCLCLVPCSWSVPLSSTVLTTQSVVDDIVLSAVQTCPAPRGE